jgi:hypothetical protein
MNVLSNVLLLFYYITLSTINKNCSRIVKLAFIHPVEDNIPLLREVTGVSCKFNKGTLFFEMAKQCTALFKPRSF